MRGYEFNRSVESGLPFLAMSIALLFVGALAIGARAQDPNYVLSVPDTAALQGSTQTFPVLLDNAGGEIQGWSFSLCYDEAALEVMSIDPGSTTATVNEGGAPDFLYIGSEPGGINMLVVICYMACDTLGVGSGYELLTTTARIDAPTGSSTTIEFCDTVGSPTTDVLFVVSDDGIVPTTDDSQLDVVSPQYVFGATTKAFGYDPVTGLGTLNDPITIEELETSAGFPNNLQGFSMAFAYDSSLLVGMSVAQGEQLAALDGGSGPDFFSPIFGGDALTIGCVFAFLGGVFMQADGPQEVAVATFQSNPAAMTGDLDGEVTDFVWGDGLGLIPTDNVVTVYAQSHAPTFSDAVITMVPVPPITDLTCTTIGAGDEIALSWTNGDVYDSIELSRNGTFVESLPGTTTTYSDGPLAPGQYTYSLVPVILDAPGSATACTGISVPPLSGLSCTLMGASVQLSWDAPAAGYDSLRLYRDGSEIESLAPGATSTLDFRPAPGAHTYELFGEVAGQLSTPVECDIEVPDQPSFVRGDGNGDHNVDIADPVYNLAYQFTMGPSLCLDAQDTNDDGNVDIADPVYNLTYLFQSGPVPHAPFPDCGQDPTDDATECDMYTCP